jgi:2-polyprenyl-3-methyl-5-hydroxy-6-metoxy-1,4-benzoquinol methylase
VETHDENTARVAPSEDAATIAYFDSHTPEYSLDRLDHAAAFIRGKATPESALLDVGCGVGNTLEFMAREAGIQHIAGLDVSEKILAQARERLGCDTYHGSILDPQVIDAVPERFDFVVVAATLHHLIGPNRKNSKERARLAFQNSLNLVKPGGFLIVHEPIYAPRISTWALFWVKKAITSVTSKRIAVGGYWANIGPPVVSYLTNEELVEIARSDSRGSVVDTHSDRSFPPLVARPFLKRWDTTVSVKRDTE